MPEANIVSYISYENIHQQMKDWLIENVDNKYINKLPDSEKVIALNRLLLIHCYEHFYFSKHPINPNNFIDCEILFAALSLLIEKGVEKAADAFLFGSSQVNKIRKLAKLLNIQPEQILEDIIDVQNINEGDIFICSSDYGLKRRPPIYLVSSDTTSAIYPLMLGKAKAMEISNNDFNDNQIWSIACHTFAELNNKEVHSNILNLSKIPEYFSGGTIHIIINNETEGSGSPKNENSCKILKTFAKYLKAPIVHVQADDVTSLMNVMIFAADFRATYNKDIVIDMICTNGKSLTDHIFLSGLLKSFISGSKYPLVTAYKNELIKEKVVSKNHCDEKRNSYLKKLNKMYTDMKTADSVEECPFAKYNSVYKKSYKEPITGSGTNTLQKVLTAICIKPPFQTSKKINKLLEKRKNTILNQKSLDWEMCENIAYATLLKEGINIHISRSCKNNHPSLLIKNRTSGKYFNQISEIFPYMGKYELCKVKGPDTGLAGFETGYSSVSFNTLNIWEVPDNIQPQNLHKIIKELIPNNYEGLNQYGITFIIPNYFIIKEKLSNAFYSSQPEKILEICCETELSINMAEQLLYSNAVIVNISTPSNLFHVLKRQAMNSIKRPLLIFIPNNFDNDDSNLSPIESITDGTSFQPYISDCTINCETNDVKNIILCTGKIYYTLLEERSKKNLNNSIAICRIEQINPFPYKSIAKDVERFSNANFWWVQEEDQLDGWWNFVESRLITFYGNKIEVKYAGRRNLTSSKFYSNKLSREELTYIFNRIEET